MRPVSSQTRTYQPSHVNMVSAMRVNSSVIIVNLLLLLVKMNTATPTRLFDNTPYLCDECHHFCVKEETSLVTCKCFQGYLLGEDKRTCKGIGDPASLIFDLKEDIAKMSITGNTAGTIEDIQAFIIQAGKITGLDIFPINGGIFYSVGSYGQLHYVDNATKRVAYGLEHPERISIDWITENIYFVDAETRIGVCHMDKQKCIDLIQLDKGSKFTALLVDPINGVMFYAIQNNDRGFIINKANLDGTNKTELINKDSKFHCYGLAMDYNKQILYYSHTENNTIESVNYEGTKRKTIIKNEDDLLHPIYLDLFEDEIFITSWRIKNIVRCKLTGNCAIIPTYAGHPRFFKLYHASKQPLVKNPCSDIYCDNICVKAPHGPVCLCNKDFHENFDDQCSSLMNITVKTFLEANGIEQDRIEQERIEKERIEILFNTFLRITKESIENERIEKERIKKARTEKERIEKERIEDEKIYSATGDPASLVFQLNADIVKMPISGNTTEVTRIPTSIASASITGLDTYPKRDGIFFSVAALGQLHYLDTATHREHVAYGLDEPHNIAVDWITENIYFVGGSFGRRWIGICQIKTQMCIRLIQLDTSANVLELLVDPINGYMFYAIHDRGFTIYKANLDGTNKTELIKLDSTFHCYGLAMDYKKQILYYSDIGSHAIESVNYEGSERNMIFKNDPYIRLPTHLDLYEDEIFTSSWSSNIYRCKLTGNCTFFTSTGGSSPFFKIYQTSKQPSVTNPCSEIYNTCDNICVKTPHGPVCLCSKAFHENFEGQCSSIKKITVKTFLKVKEIEKYTKVPQKSENVNKIINKKNE